MKAFAALCGTTALALALAGCNQAPAPAPDTHDADVKAIGDLETQWNKDYEAKDADKVSTYYADDSVLMASGMAAVSGKDAIHAALKHMVTDSALSLKFHATKVDVAKSGDVGYAQGSYTMTMTDPATKKVMNDHGSYVTVYRKQADGSWKAVSDIATSEVPPPAPAAAKKH